MSARDTQVGGDHYKRQGPYQPWEVNKAWLTHNQYVGYLLGTANAYLGRFNSDGDGKGGLQDLQKAAHTLQALIEFLEAGEGKKAMAHPKVIAHPNAPLAITTPGEVVRAKDADGWIEWTGEGEPPTGLVRCRLRGGHEQREPVTASDLIWDHANDWWDIVSYKTVEAAQ